MVGNVIVGQSGGPTAVINSSLAGVYKTAKDLGAGKVYGMRYGIQGFREFPRTPISVPQTSMMSIKSQISRKKCPLSGLQMTAPM